MTARTYYPDPEPTFVAKPEPEQLFTDPDPAVIRYSYTLQDIEQITYAALGTARGMALDYADRRDIAWSAIAEALCTASEAPTRTELVRTGWKAIYQTARAGYRQRGYQDGNYGIDGSPTMPRFVMFWGAGVVPSHEDRVVELLSLAQVFATLPSGYRDAITALAVTGDYQKAADLSGLKYGSFVQRLRRARQYALTLWHEGETPRPARRDQRVKSYSAELASECSRGHERTPENTRIERKTVRGMTRTIRHCRVCARERYRALRASEERAIPEPTEGQNP